MSRRLIHIARVVFRLIYGRVGSAARYLPLRQSHKGTWRTLLLAARSTVY